ncbi:hypothetical protein C8R44DRAFT_855925 [Mycena epipterygia]|nr:hypothetical protein C8R44DRAFT_855925 [Mycena epipterygia]
MMGFARAADTSSDSPAENSTLRGQLKPHRDGCIGAQTGASVGADTPSRDATMNGDNQTINGDIGDTATDTVRIDGNAPMPSDRNLTGIAIYGGQGGNGGEGGRTGGAGGVGQGNQVQIYLSGGEFTVNVYDGGTRSTVTRASDFVGPDIIHLPSFTSSEKQFKFADSDTDYDRENLVLKGFHFSCAPSDN